MNEDEKKALVSFLGEYWSLFEVHCHECGEDPNSIYESLGGEPE